MIGYRRVPGVEPETIANSLARSPPGASLSRSDPWETEILVVRDDAAKGSATRLPIDAAEATGTLCGES